MNILLIDLSTQIDALLAQLRAQPVQHGDIAQIFNRALQLRVDVDLALYGTAPVGQFEQMQWEAELAYLLSWLARIDGAGATAPFADAGEQMDWPAEMDRLEASRDDEPAGAAAADIDRFTDSALPGDPVSEPDPNDLPPRRRGR